MYSGCYVSSFTPKPPWRPSDVWLLEKYCWVLNISLYNFNAIQLPSIWLRPIPHPLHFTLLSNIRYKIYVPWKQSTADLQSRTNQQKYRTNINSILPLDILDGDVGRLFWPSFLLSASPSSLSAILDLIGPRLSASGRLRDTPTPPLGRVHDECFVRSQCTR